METEKKKKSEDIPPSLIVTIYFFVFGGIAFFIAATIQKSYVPLIPGILFWVAAVGTLLLSVFGAVAKEANEKRARSFEEMKSRMDKFKNSKVEDIFGKENER